jgi:DNA-binding transcriptional regulator PaaX
MAFVKSFSDEDFLKAVSNELCTTTHIRKEVGCSSATARYALLRLDAAGKIEMVKVDGVGRMWRLKGETEWSKQRKVY